jgi:hypothetical protein
MSLGRGILDSHQLSKKFLRRFQATRNRRMQNAAPAIPVLVVWGCSVLRRAWREQPGHVAETLGAWNCVDCA